MMNRAWAGVREPGVAEGFGARVEGQVPMVARAGTLRDSLQPATKRSWFAIGARMVRNALIAAVAMAVVPIAIVSVGGHRLADAMYYPSASVGARLALARPVRAFGVASDPSITPMQAGIALNALQYRPSPNDGFVAIEPATLPARPWRPDALTPDMFVTARSGMFDGPASESILEAAERGFTPREQAYLRALADAPIWREFDVVAHARAVDMIGGQLRTPFGRDALPEQRPLPSFRGSKELAYAAVSRAAYLMSVGRPQEAEQVLRSIVSFGFAFIDNGTTTLDELIGTIIVSIGRDALQRFYLIEHDPRASLPALAPPPKGYYLAPNAELTRGAPPGEIQRRLLARLADPSVPRPERMESIRALTAMSCTTVRGLLFGNGSEVNDAIARAHGTLARYPSERALIDLQTRLPSMARVPVTTNGFQSLVVSPATVAGVVLHNPRMPACTLMLTAGR